MEKKLKHFIIRGKPLKRIISFLGIFCLVSMNLKAGETLLYKTQFLDSLGPEWTGAKITQNFQAIENVLGPFNKEAISFQLPLKEKHQFVRLKFRITFLGNWGGSGNVGNDNIFEFGTSEHPDLIYASFNTLGYKYTANSLQSFPDQRNAGNPVRHWLNRTGTGFLERGRYKYNNNAEYARDTTYDFDFLIPHNKGHLELKFFSHRKGKNSNWLISYLEVSTREEALSLSPKQLKEALYMLRSKDAARAYQAKWRLIGHGKEVLNFLNCLK